MICNKNRPVFPNGTQAYSAWGFVGSDAHALYEQLTMNELIDPFTGEPGKKGRQKALHPAPSHAG